MSWNKSDRKFQRGKKEESSSYLRSRVKFTRWRNVDGSWNKDFKCKSTANRNISRFVFRKQCDNIFILDGVSFPYRGEEW